MIKLNQNTTGTNHLSPNSLNVSKLLQTSPNFCNCFKNFGALPELTSEHLPECTCSLGHNDSVPLLAPCYVMTVQQERHSILDAHQHAMLVCTTMIKGQTVRVQSESAQERNARIRRLDDDEKWIKRSILAQFFLGVDICKLVF